MIVEIAAGIEPVQGGPHPCREGNALFLHPLKVICGGKDGDRLYAGFRNCRDEIISASASLIVSSTFFTDASRLDKGLGSHCMLIGRASSARASEQRIAAKANTRSAYLWRNGNNVIKPSATSTIIITSDNPSRELVIGASLYSIMRGA